MAKEWESLNAKAEVACMHRDGHNCWDVPILHGSTLASGWEWGPVAVTPPTNLASDCSYMSRNMVQNGWRDYVQSCRSHTGYMLRDMRRGSFLSESSSTDSSDERAWFADYAGVKVEGPFKGSEVRGAGVTSHKKSELSSHQMARMCDLLV